MWRLPAEQTQSTRLQQRPQKETDKTEKQRQPVNLNIQPAHQPLLSLTREAKLQPGEESQLALSQGPAGPHKTPCEVMAGSVSGVTEPAFETKVCACSVCDLRQLAWIPGFLICQAELMIAVPATPSG